MIGQAGCLSGVTLDLETQAARQKEQTTRLIKFNGARSSVQVHCKH